MNISQKKIFDIIFFEKTSTIKTYVARIRLKFDKKEITQYLWAVYIHVNYKKRFKSIYKNWYKNNLYSYTYQNFMKNILLFSPLWKLIFKRFNERLNIKTSSMLNIVDSSLLAKKEEKYIKNKDFKNKTVTKRQVEFLGKSKSYYICGYKLLLFINRFRKIYYAQLLNINISDQNILKDSAIYQQQLGKILLADRGFNNNNVQKRLKTFNCRLISPVHYKQINQNNNIGNFKDEKERKVYKKRWSIETVFQKLKDQYQDYKIDCSGVKSKKIIEAKIFVSLTKYNLTIN
jgi:Transposase DDE domain